jgi:hypothetical protein
MKNLNNVGFVVLLLVVLGCNCQEKLQEIADKGKTPSSASPSGANASTTPASSSPTSSPSSSNSPRSTGDGLTMAKYDQLKDGMSYREVVNILGIEGKEAKTTKVGAATITTYEFSGKGNETIFCNFTNDKLTFRTQANLE